MVILLKKLFYSAFFVLCLISCRQGTTWQIVQATSVKIPVDSTAEALVDKQYQAFLLRHKQGVEGKLNTVIGQTAEVMAAGRPESLLSNFSADMLRGIAATESDTVVDIAIVNMGGLRTQFPQGNITLWHIFELMPFENELVVVWLRGEKLSELLNVIAAIGGEGISGIKMGIKDKQAVNVEVNGKPLDADKLYAIATNDFLAEGNDRLTQLAQYEKRLDTGLKLREVYVNHITSQTKQGKKITSKLDKRIYYVD